MYTKVGFIENFNRRGSYPQFGNHLPILTVKSIVVIKPMKVKSPEVIAAELELKEAKKAFKIANPAHKDRLLATSKLN